LRKSLKEGGKRGKTRHGEKKKGKEKSRDGQLYGSEKNQQSDSVLEERAGGRVTSKKGKKKKLRQPYRGREGERGKKKIPPSNEMKRREKS